MKIEAEKIDLWILGPYGFVKPKSPTMFKDSRGNVIILMSKELTDLIVEYYNIVPKEKKSIETKVLYEYKGI